MLKLCLGCLEQHFRLQSFVLTGIPEEGSLTMVHVVVVVLCLVHLTAQQADKINSFMRAEPALQHSKYQQKPGYDILHRLLAN